MVKSISISWLLLSISVLNAQYLLAQNNWDLHFPSEPRNGNFFINAPQNSDYFYLFGHSVKSLNLQTQALAELPSLPSDILFKEGTTGITAPYRHMDLFTLDDQQWWMVHEGRILKTTNAGMDWQEVLSLNPNTQYLSSSYFTSIHFPSENVGYAVGTADKIFKSTDGGTTWQALQWSTSTAPYRRFNQVYFVSENEGFAMGYEVDDILLNIGVFRPFIRRTNDGGLTWTEINLPESDHHYVDIDIVGSSWYVVLRNRNFVAPADRLFRVVNDGNNWNSLNLPGSTSSSSLVIRDMHWFSETEGLILGTTDIFDQPNRIYKTYNSGATWEVVPIDSGTAPFFGRVPNLVMHFNGDYGIISGASGNLLFSFDKGATWQSLKKGYPDIWDMSSASGISYAALYGQALLKHNGLNWEELDMPLNSTYQIPGAFAKISNQNTNEVAAIDTFGELLYSDDAGSSWTSWFSDPEMRVLDIQFHNGQLSALIIDTDGSNRLLYYPNALNPQNFEIIIDGTSLPASVFDLFYVGDTIFTRVETLLFKKANGTWEQVLINDGVIRSMLMDEAGNAMMKFSDNNYYYSNDSAQSWSASDFSTAILDKVDFEISSISGFGKLNTNTHFALVHGAADYGQRFETYLMLSSDNGASWEFEDSAIFSEPQDFGRIGYTVDDDNNLWIGSANAAIYRYSNGSLSVPETPMVTSFSVFPNPTSGRIQLQLSETIMAYQLFNIQGQLVKRGQINEDATLEIPDSYPEGLYILKLKTTNNTEVSLKVIKK